VDYLLTPRQQELVDWVGELADVFAERAGEHDRDASFPFDNYKDMQEAGYLKLTVPKEFGGFGASLHELVLAQERLAMGCGSTALAVQMHVSPVAQMADMWRATGDDAIEPFFRDVAEGRIVWASLTSERGVGNSITDSTVEAKRVDGGYRIAGQKIFCTNTDVATHFSFTARYEDPEHGPQVMISRAAMDAEGLELVRTWDTLGMRATQSNDLRIDGLFVPDEDVIHSFPVNHLDGVVVKTVFAHAMPVFGAVYIGIAGGAMEWARDFILKAGKQDDSEIQHLFAEMEILRQTARSVIWHFADEVESGQLLERRSVQDALANAVIAKYVACNNAVRIVDKVFDVVGGAAYHRRFPVERMYRDVRAGSVMPYNNRDAYKLLGQTVLGIEVLPENPLSAALDSYRAARGASERTL
jgi:alkylation response protein AidB-like acyl-CoA dehydrogenase